MPRQWFQNHPYNLNAGLSCTALVLMIGVSVPLAGFAASMGMVSDNGSGVVHIFNADLDVVTAKLEAHPGKAVGDCVLASDEQLGFTSSNSGVITFVDLATRNLQSVPRSKLVAISNVGVDLALSPDDAFLVVAGGGALQQPLSVVDTALQEEIATAGPFADHSSVEFCDNGTILVTTTHGKYYGSGPDNALYDATIDGEGMISLQGHRLSSGAQPNNVTCAPGSMSGVLLDREGGLSSFTLPGLEMADYVSLDSSIAVAAVFSPNGKQLFVRTRDSVKAFHFNPVTGTMRPDWKQPLAATSTFYGVDQIAIHPNGNKLYVDGGAPMLILDPRTGSQTGAINFGDTTGICFASSRGPQVGAQLASGQP